MRLVRLPLLNLTWPVYRLAQQDGRHPDEAEVAVILEWKDPMNVAEARGFIGVCIYFGT